MKHNELLKLEKDEKFRRKYFPLKSYLNILMVPPSCILFLALFGLLYLFNYDMLISYYAIPFVVLLLLGTIWFKAVKKHIYTEVINKDNAFSVCVAKVIGSAKGGFCLVFALGENRHNKALINTITKDLKAGFEDLRSNILNLDTAAYGKSFPVDGYENVQIVKMKKMPRKFNSSNLDQTLQILYINGESLLILPID